MVTKRELAEAQRELNEAVGNLLTAFADPVPGRTGSARMRLQLAFDEWNRVRVQLDGQGPAVARSTSIAAAKANIMHKQSLRRDVLTLVYNHWMQYRMGCTSDYVQGRLRGKHQSVSARISELVNTYGLLKDGGDKMKTSSGAMAICWVPTDEAIALFDAAVERDVG